MLINIQKWRCLLSPFKYNFKISGCFIWSQGQSVFLVGEFYTNSLNIWVPLLLKVKNESDSVMSDSLQPQGLFSPWNSLGQNTGVGRHSLLQGIFPTQGSTQVSHSAADSFPAVLQRKLLLLRDKLKFFYWRTLNTWRVRPHLQRRRG